MKDNNVDFGLRTFLKELGGIAGGTALLATVPWLSSCTPARLKETAGEVVRIGMIGTGSRGQFHLHNLKAIPAARVTVLCDTYEPNLRAAADIVGSGPGTRTAANSGTRTAANSGTRTAAGAGSNTRTPAGVKTCTDWRRVLDDPDVDAVIIATPLHLHAEMTIAALQAGKHVFCEKAMALTEDDCLAAYRAYTSGDRVLFYGMQRLFDPKYLEAIRLIHEGKIGDIVGMRCHWFRNADWRRAVPSPELERHINWRLYREYSGGLMTELGSHQLEVCNWALGLMPVQVTGMGDIVYWRDGREVYDSVNVTYRYSNGCKICYESLIANKYNGMEEQILGSKGTLDLAKGVYWLEEDNEISGMRQLLGQVRDGVFSAVPAAGPSWRPELRSRYVPHAVMKGNYGVAAGESMTGESGDGSDVLLEAFCQACITGEKAADIVEEAYCSTLLCLLGNRAMETGRVLDFPAEYVIPYMKF